MIPEKLASYGNKLDLSANSLGGIMRRKNKILYLMVIGVFLAGTAGTCRGPGNLEKSQEVAPAENTPTLESVDVSPEATAAVSETPVSEEVVEATATAFVPPTPRAELESTDPASVNLASGQVQLVELFAFW